MTSTLSIEGRVCATVSCFAVAVASLLRCTSAHAQVQPLNKDMARSEGVEPSSGIAYTRIYLHSTQHLSVTEATGPNAEFDLDGPTLTVQCTQRPNGKYYFELFVNFGGVTDTKFYPPWKRTQDDLYPPVTKKVTMTMEFLGYTKVKPVKHEFEYVVAPYGQLRYTTPGFDSKNLEDITYYLQFLRALPTLRLTGEGHSAEFFTTPLLEQLRAEKLCGASGLSK